MKLERARLSGSVIRPTRLILILTWGYGIACGFVALGIWFMGGPWAIRLGIALAAGSLSIYYLGLSRIRIQLLADQLLVQNAFRSHLVAWTELRGFVIKRRWIALPYARIGHVHTRDGALIPSDVLVARAGYDAEALTRLIETLARQVESNMLPETKKLAVEDWTESPPESLREG